MLAYFPTEQPHYLRIHDIIPAAITLPIIRKTVTFNAKKLLQASSRFYLTYIILEFFRLKKRSGLLRSKQKALNKASANDVEANAEKAELRDSWDTHRLAAVYNTFRLPGALHWYVVLHDSRFVSSFLHGLCMGFAWCVVPSTLTLSRLSLALGSYS